MSERSRTAPRYVFSMLDAIQQLLGPLQPVRLYAVHFEENLCDQMPDFTVFTAKMHQILFPRGSGTDPAVELTALPRTCIYRGRATLRRRERRGEESREEGKVVPPVGESESGSGTAASPARETRRARRGAWVEAFRHFFVPLQALSLEI